MSAAKTAIGCHGDDLADQLMDHCEGCLQSAGDTRESDVIRQSVVVLMGTLARHLDKGNPKVMFLISLIGTGFLHIYLMYSIYVPLRSC